MSSIRRISELIERETGGRLRSIEFIYSASGVNRPLTPSDNPDKNLNKTFYRDQINKVANTIKEIIYSVHPDERKRATRTYQTREQADHTCRPQTFCSPGPRRRKTVTVNGHLPYPPLLAVATPADSASHLAGMAQQIEDCVHQEDDAARKAIAIMPVANLTGNPDLGWIPHDNSG
ncbi:MAG: hypothetical protein MZV63_39270 [Marinilabiliales bacterium]|nr:hypothetical protein [Marinilabiliales bacterium]